MGAVKACADSFEGHLGVFLGEIHHHLACIADFAFARFGEELIRLNLIVCADLLGNNLEIDLAQIDFHGVCQHSAGKIDGYAYSENCGMDSEGHHYAFELADAFGDI